MRSLQVLNEIQGKPNVVQLITAFATNTFAVVVMSYASNGSLYSFMREKGQEIGSVVLRQMIGQIIVGVEAVHQAGFCHMDIKPDNILVDSKFNILVGDFGCALLCNVSRQIRLTHHQHGTVSYRVSSTFNYKRGWNGNISYGRLSSRIQLLAPIKYILNKAPSVSIETFSFQERLYHFGPLRIIDRCIEH